MTDEFGHLFDFDIVVDHGEDIDSFLDGPRQNMLIDEIVTREKYQKMQKIAKLKQFKDDVNVILVQETGSYHVRGDRSANKWGIPVPEGSVKIMVASSTRQIMETFQTRVSKKSKPKK